ncbi:hypothetical protein [Pseudonocardia sp. HH130629-09]|uniref:hypothetical protein n=1 Tax=Pseudonocardia sp. HH130629-09 TaxID=1641402 RepID=UPI0011AE5831|nr:hypothetical protein [Pseudonocardia sp. HH130629-09]
MIISEARDEQLTTPDLVHLDDLICPGCGDHVIGDPPLGWDASAGLAPEFSHRDGSVLCPDSGRADQRAGRSRRPAVRPDRRRRGRLDGGRGCDRSGGVVVTGRDGRSRVRQAAMEWDVPVDTARVEDLDERLRDGRCGRTGWMQVLIDHDTPSGRCPGCGWATTSSRRDCPSRVIAKALLERAPLPAWLAHLVNDVPGARTKANAATREQQRAEMDETPGLFAAPARVPDPRGPQ